MLTKRIAAVVLALLLSACAASNIAPDYKLAASKGAGVATGSITYGGDYGAYRLLIKSESTGETYRIEHGASQTLNIALAFKGEAPHPGLKSKGSPFAVELPAGRYQLASWQIVQGGWSFTSSEATGVSFEVRTGEAIYLGSFDFQGGAKFFGAARPARVALADEAARDLSVLKAEFKALDAAPLAQALTPGTRIAELGGVGGVRLTIPIYIPIAR